MNTTNIGEKPTCDPTNIQQSQAPTRTMTMLDIVIDDIENLIKNDKLFTNSRFTIDKFFIGIYTCIEARYEFFYHINNNEKIEVYSFTITVKLNEDDIEIKDNIIKKHKDDVVILNNSIQIEKYLQLITDYSMFFELWKNIKPKNAGKK
jgi:hypothetical protein